MIETSKVIEAPVVDCVSDEVGKTSLLLVIDPSLKCLQGHFPRYPILPGVVQVAWAVESAGKQFGLSGTVKVLERLKFMHPIQPPAKIKLVLEQSGSSMVNFKYCDDHRTYASGRLIYGS